MDLKNVISWPGDKTSFAKLRMGCKVCITLEPNDSILTLMALWKIHCNIRTKYIKASEKIANILT